MEPKEKYVCVGECGGAADKPGACETDGCSKKGDPLVRCMCNELPAHCACGEPPEKSEK